MKIQRTCKRKAVSPAFATQVKRNRLVCCTPSDEATFLPKRRRCPLPLTPAEIVRKRTEHVLIAAAHHDAIAQKMNTESISPWSTIDASEVGIDDGWKKSVSLIHQVADTFEMEPDTLVLGIAIYHRFTLVQPIFVAEMLFVIKLLMLQ